jgi:GNAT superfamily N-acetyltransferase
MSPAFEFGPVGDDDVDDLLALRIRVMRESLERLGRFDPQRAAQRFRTTFRSADTRRILVTGQPAGCVAFWAEPGAMRIEHFYVDAPYQRQGIGAAVLRQLFDEAPLTSQPPTTCLRVGALRGSDANRFYERHGFVKVSESEWDIEYERPHLPALTGGCLCGAVRYRARPTHREGYYCHCRMCQLAFGNTRAAFVHLRKNELTWTTQAPVYHASSAFARRGFCARCGSPLSFEYLDSVGMDVSVGSLDDPAAVLPVSHFAVESRLAAWHAEDGLPGERLDEHAMLTERWKAAYGQTVTPGVQATRAT